MNSIIKNTKITRLSEVKSSIQIFLMENKQIIENQKKQKVELYYAIPHTIIADNTSNQQFFRWKLKITLALFFIVLFLKALPSPIIINTIQNDPQAFTKELCQGEEECSNVDEGYESIIIKKVNSFQRQLKYFVKLNYQKYESLSKYFNNTQVDLNNEITWIQIFAYRNGQTYGQVLYQKSGEDIYEILFDNQALIFVGQIHILEEHSYMIKIYKLIKTFRENIQSRRLIKEIDQNFIKVNQTSKEQSISSKHQYNYRQIKISIPLTVQIVRYSQFYTIVQMIIRYITLLIILYVRTQTINSPAIFHYILILTSNPLICIEIAFPNLVTNVISTIFSSMYIVYLAVFLYYCHRKLEDSRLDLGLKLVKLIFFISLWVATILRHLHLVNHTKIQFVQKMLMAIVLLPLFHHLWTLYFFKSKTIVHRNILFIFLTGYFLLLFFFSDYLINQGWKKISTYLIVQMYGCELCYLTAIYINQEEESHDILKYQQTENRESSHSYQANILVRQPKYEPNRGAIDEHLDSPEDKEIDIGLYIKVL